MNEKRVEMIRDYRVRITAQERVIADSDAEDTFGRIDIVEANRAIRDYEDRIAGLERQIAGMPDPESQIPTPEQIAGMAYVMSDEYDDD